MPIALRRQRLLTPAAASLDLDMRARRLVVNSDLRPFGGVIGYGRNSTATYLDRGGRYRASAANVPRFGYDAQGNPLGLLLDSAASNLLAASENLGDAAWAKSGLTLVPNFIAKLRGQQDTAVIVDTGSSPGVIKQTAALAGTGNQPYAASAYLGAYNGRVVTVGYQFGGGSQVQSGSIDFDVIDGVVVSAAPGVSARMVPAPNGLWRCVLVVANLYGANALTVSFARAVNNGGTGFYITAPQLTPDGALHSYVPRTAAAAGAVASDLLTADSTAWLNQADGTFLWEGVIDSGAAEDVALFNLRGAGSSLSLLKRNTDQGSAIQVERDGYSIRMLGAAPGAALRVAFSYRGPNFVAVKAGGARDYLNRDAQTMAATALAGINTLDIGNLAYGAVMTGSIGRVTHIPAQLSADQLSQLVA